MATKVFCVTGLKWQSITIRTQNTVLGKLRPTVISVTLTYVHLAGDKISLHVQILLN